MNITINRRKLTATVAVVVAVVVAANWFITDDDPGVPTQARPATATVPAPTIEVTTGPDVIDPGHTTPRPANPRPPAGAPPQHEKPAEPPAPTTDPAAREAAAAFAAAWLNTFGRTAPQWHAALRDHITDQLAADLAGADPATVPVGVVGSPINMTADGSLWDADVPVLRQHRGAPAGTLRVTLVSAGRGWLVSEIDWENR